MATITQLAKHFDKTPNTIRRWCSAYSDFLSPDANPPKGEARILTDEDTSVLVLVGEMRRDHASDESIQAALAAGDRGTWPPVDETEPIPENQAALTTQLMAQIAHRDGEIAAVKAERDRLIADLENERISRIDAEKEAARLQGKLEALEGQEGAKSVGWFDRLLGRG